jgi:hypothetical protein
LAASSRQQLGFGVCFLGASVLQGLAIAGMGLAPASAVAVGCAAAWSAGITVRDIVTMSLRQQITPDHLLGQVMSTFWALGLSSAPIGAALATWSPSAPACAPC